MYDMDISGTDKQVSLVFENAKVEGSRKLMQKVMIWLVQPLDVSDNTSYGSGFYDSVRNSNMSALAIIQGALDIALTNIHNSLIATSQEGDPQIAELSGVAVHTADTLDGVSVTIKMLLEDGTSAEDSLTITESEE